MDMYILDTFIKELNYTGSRLGKEAILKTATPEIKEVLKFLYDPFIVTGIKEKKVEARMRTLGFYHMRENPEGQVDFDLLSTLNYFKSHNTGADKDVDFALLEAYKTPFPELVISIITKSLVLGVNATTLNKVYGKGFIPHFGVQLAQRYDFDNPFGNEEFYLTEKLDGVRCVISFEHDKDSGYFPVLYARSGKRIEGLVDIEKEAKKLNPSFVYDGELIISGEEDSNVLYRKTMSVIGSNGEKNGVVFHVFDMVNYLEFKEGMSTTPYEDRRILLNGSCEDGKWIQKVPTLYKGRDKEEIQKWLKWAQDNRKEGVMINLADSPYICDRTSGLLKVKRFKECEAVVRSVERGTGKNSGRLGAVIVDIKDGNGNFHSVRVGSGFTDLERDDYFLNQNKVVGKVVEIGYFEVTRNKADNSLSLRFPTWMDRIRIDKEEEDITPI